MKHILKFSFLIITLLSTSILSYAHKSPHQKREKPLIASNRANCRAAIAQIDLDINNVRARLTTGGDVWWDGSDGLYVVPKPSPGQPAVSSIFAGGVWVGGNDEAGNLKLAGVTYKSLTDNFDWYSGPLDLQGETEESVCRNWDKFFVVSGENIKNIIGKLGNIDCDSIPDDIKYWPGDNNPHWGDKYDFPLPIGQSLGAFWDEDGDGIYDPCNGDFPTIEIRGCGAPSREKAKELVPDEMVFWIYNDNGGPHRLTAGDAIQMEVQVQAFAYATNDEINDMSFYRYKLINKADSDIRDCYFGMWVDPDLGCYQDDYSGCDVPRSLAYTYNEDGIDGINGATCDGVNTYGLNIPMIGTDYFRGPRGPKVFARDKDGNIIYYTNPKTNMSEPVLLDPPFKSGLLDTLIELGMTSFMYTNNSGVGSSEAPTHDPVSSDDQFYNNLRGFWRTGEPLTFGGTGYNPGGTTDTVKFAFPDAPDKIGGWSMLQEGLGFGDRRTLQATGPLLLQPGAINELIIGAVWVPDVDHPSPSLEKIQSADDVAQALFDNCFDITDGPDAPEITGVELDRQLVLAFVNDEKSSNNKFLSYVERDLRSDNDTIVYRFEGYRIYQLANAQVTPQELSNPEKAKEILKTDLKNNISEIFNWTSMSNPNAGAEGQPENLWTSTRKISGPNKGLQTTLSVIEDQFAKGDRRLINHKEYHFMAIAYAHNEYLKFNPLTLLGQRTPYLEGRGKIRRYTYTPRPIVYEKLNAGYGDGVKIIRLSGQGNGGNFLDVSSETREAMAKGTLDGKRIPYLDGAGPINVKIFNPFEIQDGKYRLDIKGKFEEAGSKCFIGTDANYSLIDINNGNAVISQGNSLKEINEQIIYKKGFSVTLGQVEEPGKEIEKGGKNGAQTQILDYKDKSAPLWFNAVFDGDNGLNQFLGPTFSSTFDPITNNSSFDPQSVYSKLGTGHFFPFLLSKFENEGVSENPPPFLTTTQTLVHPTVIKGTGSTVKLSDLNNVDVVFTPNKDLWSRCIVVETANLGYTDAGFTTLNKNRMMEVRTNPSIGKDGKPDNSGTKGFSWFPGYAVDVETGERLNIFFGENTIFRQEGTFDYTIYLNQLPNQKKDICTDMLFNPNSTLFSGEESMYFGLNQVAGGHHFIYVTRQKYDECKQLSEGLRTGTNTSAKRDPFGMITWACIPLISASNPIKSVEEGLIPSELTVKLRVNNAYNKKRNIFDYTKIRSCITEEEFPSYEFEISGKQGAAIADNEYQGALENVNVVPNPYYANSAYENSTFSNVVKITNLPEKAIITIYSLDGKFIRKYSRDERYANNTGNNPANNRSQPVPDLIWDLKNFQGIQVASGVYLIHVYDPDHKVERTIKWFGVGRKFDPSGL